MVRVFFLLLLNLGFNGSAGNQNATANSFVSDSNFSSVFGASEPVGKLFVRLFHSLFALLLIGG